MKKIVFLIDSLDGGGAEKILLNIVKNLDKKKYEIEVVTIFNRGIYVEEIVKYANYSYIFKCKNNNKTFFSRFLILLMSILSSSIYYRFLIKNKYDIEVAFLEGISTKIISGSTNENSKKIAWIHTDLINHSASSKKYLNFSQEVKAYKKFDDIICVSSDSRYSFEKKYFKSKKVVNIGNPIDEKEIKEYSMLEIEDEFSSSHRNVIAIGKLDKNKSFDRLIRVAKTIIEEGLIFNLYILGIGLESETLLSYVNENKLNKYVHLLGFKRNPYPYIVRSDFLVNSSYAEGYNTAIAEALILQKPVVATKTAGVIELFGGMSCGIITENSEMGLYKGIKKMLTDDELFESSKKQAAIRASAFSINSKMMQIERVLEG